MTAHRWFRTSDVPAPMDQYLFRCSRCNTKIWSQTPPTKIGESILIRDTRGIQKIDVSPNCDDEVCRDIINS